MLKNKSKKYLAVMMVVCACITFNISSIHVASSTANPKKVVCSKKTAKSVKKNLKSAKKILKSDKEDLKITTKFKNLGLGIINEVLGLDNSTKIINLNIGKEEGKGIMRVVIRQVADMLIDLFK